MRVVHDPSSIRGTLERTHGFTDGPSMHRAAVKLGIGLKAYPARRSPLKRAHYGRMMNRPRNGKTTLFICFHL